MSTEPRPKNSKIVFNVVSAISLLYSAGFVIFSFSFFNSNLAQLVFFQVLIAGLNIAGFFCIPATFWMTAKRIVDRENEIASSSKGALFTFLQIIYLPIGIYWLSPRVKRHL